MENKLSTEQKFMALAFILLVATCGAAIGFAVYKGNWFIAITFTSMLYLWYQLLVHMLTWVQIKNEENNTNNSNFGIY
jgi:uncharacterized membrane protein